MYDIVTIGEALIDLAAMESDIPLKDVSTFKRVAGGAPFNVAIGVSKIGLNAGFISRVGDDAFGQHILSVLDKYNVEKKGVQIDPSHHTGLAFIGLPTPNTRDFLFYRNPSADMMIRNEDIPGDLLSETRIFHFGSISLISPVSREATLFSVNRAKNAGSLISYDPNLRLSLWQDEKTAREAIIDEIPKADIIKVNDEELFFLFEKEDYNYGIDALLEMGPCIVLCTKGEYGSILATSETRKSFPVYPCRTVDSTGCGDSFYSAFLSSICSRSRDELLSKPELLEKAVTFGAAAAAITATQKGVTEALPTKAEIMNLIQSNKA